MEFLACGDGSSIGQQRGKEHSGTYRILALHSDGAFASHVARASLLFVE